MIVQRNRATRGGALTFGARFRNELVHQVHGPVAPFRSEAGGGVRARCWAEKRTAIPPSPTAGAAIFVDPERTSPTAKTPGRLVSTGNGLWRSAVHGS
jgi:hypothetical protein